MNAAMRQPVTKTYRRVGGTLLFVKLTNVQLKGICLGIPHTVAIMHQFSLSVVCNWDESSRYCAFISSSLFAVPAKQ